MKYFNFKRYKFSTIFKNINLIGYKISKIFKYIDFRRYNFSKFIKYIDFRRYNFSKLVKYIDFRRYNFSKIYKLVNLKENKYNYLYIFSAPVFFLIIYLNLPLFYDFNKKNIENIFCNDFHIKCSIEGKIKYFFLPSPRYKITSLKIKDFTNENKIIGEVKNVELLIPLKSLHKKKFLYKKANIKNFEINFNLEKLKKYKSYFEKKIFLKASSFKKGIIHFYDNENKISSIQNVKINYKPGDDVDKLNLKGIFLDDEIDINFKNKKQIEKPIKIFTVDLKKNAIFTKINIYNSESNKDTFNGDLAFKKGKNRLTAFFDYKNNKLNFKKSKLRNILLDGEFSGTLSFFPYFGFNLNLDLKGLNFTKLHTFLINLDDDSRENLFALSKKINGQLSLSANKIYSRYNLIKSIESQLKFINGSILIDRFLFNLGKIGAADLTGLVENDKKFSNLKFESNIFVDNKKKFISKLGAYGQKDISSNFYIRGNLDLTNLKILFKEIEGNENIPDDDVSYIQKEFNNILLEKGYESFFNFANLKEFVKSISSTK